MAEASGETTGVGSSAQGAEAQEAAEAAPIVSVTRIETFSAAHRLHSAALSDAENAAVFGKCNNAHGHGHNYRLEVTVRGPVDVRTGMVINLTDLKRLIDQHVLALLDHRCLDKDVPFFAAAPPRTTEMPPVSTTEMLAVFVWRQMHAALTSLAHLYPHVRLHKIKLHETDKNSVVYRGP